MEAVWSQESNFSDVVRSRMHRGSVALSVGSAHVTGFHCTRGHQAPGGMWRMYSLPVAIGDGANGPPGRGLAQGGEEPGLTLTTGG